MRLPGEFEEQLANMADLDLYDILAHKQDYLPEAAAAASCELQTRNLTPETMAQLEAAVRSKDLAAEVKAQQRLNWPMRIVVATGLLPLLCLGSIGMIVPFLVACYYQVEGNNRKARDCRITAGISIGILFVLGGLLSALR